MDIKLLIIEKYEDETIFKSLHALKCPYSESEGTQYFCGCFIFAVKK